MANNRKRNVERLRKAEERQQWVDRLIAALCGSRDVRLQAPKESDDLVFGYFQSTCEVAAVDNAWGFKLYKNGQLWFKYGRRPPEWKFQKESYQLPKEAVVRLQDLLRPMIPAFRKFVMHTEYLGLDGWDDTFYFLGYHFSAWCIHYRKQEELADYEAGSVEYDDYQQDLTVLDLFQKGCGILRDYGFDITLDGFEKM